jgi:dihydrofolate synthase/folylpolyglutamate synthase
MALRQRYNDVLRRLYNVNKTFTVTMRLDNIAVLHELAGRPLDAFETVVHVAGTNGKGSVCWKTAAALQHAGHRVGLFTSPHIASFRERARVDGRLASEAAVVGIMEELFALTEHEGLQCTSFFE